MPCDASQFPSALRSLAGRLVKPALAALLLFAAAPHATQATVPKPSHLIRPDGPEIQNPDVLVDRYLQAVDRGELRLFGHTLTRAMIVPSRVEYVYELLSRTTRIKIHAHLKAPLPVPGQPGCQILGVSAVMEDDRITEIESHIWMKP